MSEKITMDNVLPLLKAAVDTRGEDYRYLDHYEMCEYKSPKDGSPACLIGVVLASVGIPIADLDEVDTELGSIGISELVQDGLLPDVDPEAAEVLSVAQMVQDKGSTWGAAYDAAVEAVERGAS